MHKLFIIIYLSLGFTAITFAQTAHQYLREGDAAYDKANYATAEEGYRKAAAENFSYKSDYNLANTLYKQDRFEEATQYYQSAIPKITNEELKAKAYHNLGNSLFKEEKLKQSIEAYKNALRINPEDVETKYNLQKTKQMVKMQQQQEQQQQQQDENQENEENDQKQEEQENQDSEEEQDQDKKEEEDNNDEEPKEQDEQKESDTEDQQSEDNNESSKTGEEDKQTLDKEDALKLLQVIENEEKKVQEKLRRIQDQGKKPEKDW